MSVPVGSVEAQHFRALVGVRLGLRFEDSKLSQLAELLSKRLSDTSQTSEAYLSQLQSPDLPREELRMLARELTVGETYFLRNPDQFRAFSEVVLPDRMRARRDVHRVRILSAGCASGEEPYSLAILLADRVDPSWSISIRAVDLNTSALAKAARARYSSWALRDTPAEVQRRWFREEGRDLVLEEDVRRFVTFEEANLAEANPELWQHESYDIVFCRNVIMYFTPENSLALVERLERSLVRGGYLFLGHAETLRGLSQDFHLRHTHGTFYYQRRQTPPMHVAADSSSRRQELAPAPLLDAVEGTDTWIEAIRQASERIHALADASERVTGSGAVTGSHATSPPRWDLASATELLKSERFGEALDAVHRLPPEAAADPEVLLLRATLLTHNGQLPEAEKACKDLLDVDELSAGAHYLLALCREGLGDTAGARHHDQLAVYLDPGFAMPRLHMGLLARRAGDRSEGSRELSQALDLLRREDSSRLLLFGGGFSREALTALCRAELNACGVTS